MLCKHITRDLFQMYTKDCESENDELSEYFHWKLRGDCQIDRDLYQLIFKMMKLEWVAELYEWIMMWFWFFDETSMWDEWTLTWKLFETETLC